MLTQLARTQSAYFFLYISQFIFSPVGELIISYYYYYYYCWQCFPSHSVATPGKRMLMYSADAFYSIDSSRGAALRINALLNCQMPKQFADILQMMILNRGPNIICSTFPCYEKCLCQVYLPREVLRRCKRNVYSFVTVIWCKIVGLHV